MRLKDKVAIITGAGSSGPGIGTGKAISSTFAKEGAKVILVDKDIDRANETLELIKSEGNYHGGFAIAGDVTSLKDCENITSKTISEFGKLDILVNNVGILAPGNVINVTEENYDEFKNRFEKENGDLVGYVLSVRDYETLALNMSDIKRFLQQQKELIVYYEKAVAPLEKEKK